MFYFPFLDEFAGLLRADFDLDGVRLFLAAGLLADLLSEEGLAIGPLVADPLVFCPGGLALDGFRPAVFLIFLPSTPSNKKSIFRSSKLTEATFTSTGSPKR